MPCALATVIDHGSLIQSGHLVLRSGVNSARPLVLKVGQEELQQLVKQQVRTVVLGQLKVAASHSMQSVNDLGQVHVPHGHGCQRVFFNSL